jgi:hypothetical protein
VGGIGGVATVQMLDETNAEASMHDAAAFASAAAEVPVHDGAVRINLLPYAFALVDGDS